MKRYEIRVDMSKMLTIDAESEEESIEQAEYECSGSGVDIESLKVITEYEQCKDCDYFLDGNYNTCYYCYADICEQCTMTDNKNRDTCEACYEENYEDDIEDEKEGE